MFDGYLEFVTLLLAFVIVLLVPGIATVALLLVVAALIVGAEIRRPAEDAERSTERDR